MKNKLHLFLLLGIFALGLFLRFYKLGEVPFGFYQDESAIGYNAYSIMQTGKDEHGMMYPLYFKSFGDYKLPVYIYVTIPSIALFGMTEFAVRFPSAFFGFFTLVVFYFFVKEISQKESLALVATFLLAINPWSLHYNRATFEVSISLFLFVLGGFLLLRSDRKRWSFFLGTLCFGVGFYTYNLTRLFAPVLYVIFLLFINRKVLKKTEVYAATIVGIVLLLPFALTFFKSGGVSSAGGTLIFSSAAVKAPLLEFRNYMPHAIGFLLFNTPILLAWQFVINVFSYLSIPFFFISGSSHGNHGIGNVGEFYLFELPLITIGIFYSYKFLGKYRNLLFYWTLATILIASLTRDVPHATRSFFMVAPLEIFSALGILICWSYLRKIKALYLNPIVLVIILLAAYSILFYFSSYYFRFPILYAKAWRQQDKVLSLYLSQNETKYKQIIIDKNSGFIYSSYLFFTKYSPKDFQKSSVWEPDDSEGISMVSSFGKYEFRDINWGSDLATPGTLIVTSVDRKPVNVPAVAVFSYPKRPVVFAVKQDIVSDVVQDSAYVVVESK